MLYALVGLLVFFAFSCVTLKIATKLVCEVPPDWGLIIKVNILAILLSIALGFIMMFLFSGVSNKFGETLMVAIGFFITGPWLYSRYFEVSLMTGFIIAAVNFVITLIIKLIFAVIISMFSSASISESFLG